MHIDPDLLALLALGEEVATPADQEHLAGCPLCRDDVQNLRHAAVVGRSALGAGELLEPAPRVWSRIVDELKLDVVAAPPPVRSLPLGGARARRVGRWVPALVAASAIVVLAAGSLVSWSVLRPQSATVLASASLQPYPAWPDASGTAVVEQQPDGSRVVVVTLDDPDPNDGYREVWLITSDTTQLVSLGIVEGSAATFAIPDGIDLSRYDLVDISAELIDGDPTHSGDSIVRGQLS